MPNDKLPIKVVFAGKDDYHKLPTSRSKRKVFVEVTPKLRRDLVGKVAAVGSHFESTFRAFPKMPAAAKVILRKDALAKSHRPDGIFDAHTCPVIGVTDAGQLVVSVTKSGLDAAAERIATGEAHNDLASISAIREIQPWTGTDALTASEECSDVEASGRSGERAYRCRLFHHPHESANAAVREGFLRVARDLGVPVQEVRYTRDASVFALPDVSGKTLHSIADCASVQNVARFPEYRIVRTAARSIGSLTASHLPNPVKGQAYGTVGVIDSGTDPNNAHVQAWVVARVDEVPRDRQNHTHGTFVAGLIANSRTLNNSDRRFPLSSAHIVDIAALDKHDGVREADLIDIVDRALKKYPDVKVWNLSLGVRGRCCDERRFSDLAAALDERAREHGVLFVVAAGNYEKEPMRKWPPPPDLSADRISPPGDSVRSVTVGSIAHLATAGSLVKVEEPSPFSRRGPAPAYLLKPEVTHYGGNCDASGRYLQTGIVSVDGAGNLAEDIGTSFATPLVASIAANVWNELAIAPDAANPQLVKALLVHSAFLKGVPANAKAVHYFGIGVPAEVGDVLACSQSSATVILQIPVKAGPRFEKPSFPMPKCLERPNGLKADLFMTLLHDAPLDSNYGAEYCRSNVAASLGTMRVNTKTGEIDYNREIGSVPTDFGEGLERDLVSHGFKWSPLKLYHRRFTKGPANADWRLTLTRLDRAEYTSNAAQDVVLIVTIRDPEGEAGGRPVYDELVQAMNRLGWINQDLQVRSRLRIQA